MSDLSAKPEKNYRAKTKQADSQSGYLGDKIVGSTYINVTEEDGSVGKRLKLEVDSSALADGIVDHKVLVSSGDTTENYLFNKLVEGNAITLTQQNIGGNENILIDASYTEGDGIDITDDEISLDADLDDLNDVYSPTPSNGDLLRYDNASGKWVDDYTLEGTFTGTTTKVPSSSAVSNVLQTCMITDDDDLGTSGDALMYRVKDIPLSTISVIEDSDVTLTSASGHDDHPSYAEIIQLTTIWEDSGGAGYGRGALNILVMNTTDGGEESNTCAACVVPLSVDEDLSDEDGEIYFDFLFSCAKTEGAQELAEVRLYPIYNKIDDVDRIPIVGDPVYGTVTYEASTGVDKVNKVTFTVDTSGDVSGWINGWALLTVGSSGQTGWDSNEVTIVGARMRYKTKTIGLRIADVTL